MMGIAKTRTPEQVSKKMINEERTIMDLELAIKKEQFRNILIEKYEDPLMTYIRLVLCLCISGI